MIDKDKVSKTISPEKLAKDKRDKETKETKDDKYFEQPPSDTDDDICGPLNCDKEL